MPTQDYILWLSDALATFHGRLEEGDLHAFKVVPGGLVESRCGKKGSASRAIVVEGRDGHLCPTCFAQAPKAPALPAVRVTVPPAPQARRRASIMRSNGGGVDIVWREGDVYQHRHFEAAAGLPREEAILQACLAALEDARIEDRLPLHVLTAGVKSRQILETRSLSPTRGVLAQAIENGELSLQIDPLGANSLRGKATSYQRRLLNPPPPQPAPAPKNSPKKALSLVEKESLAGDAEAARVRGEARFMLDVGAERQIVVASILSVLPRPVLEASEFGPEDVALALRIAALRNGTEDAIRHVMDRMRALEKAEYFLRKGRRIQDPLRLRAYLDEASPALEPAWGKFLQLLRARLATEMPRLVAHYEATRQFTVPDG